MLQIALFDRPPHLLELSTEYAEISLLHVIMLTAANYALGYHSLYLGHVLQLRASQYKTSTLKYVIAYNNFMDGTVAFTACFLEGYLN